MRDRPWHNRLQATGLSLAGLATIAILSVFAFYSLPSEPALPRTSAEASSKNYLPGGSGCNPAKIRELPAEKRQVEIDRCQAASEQHRQSLQTLEQARRAGEVAELELALHAQDARFAYWQTLTTIATFLAAAWAAGVAWRAMVWAKSAAVETKRGADAAHSAASLAGNQLVQAQDSQRAWVMVDEPKTAVNIQGDGRRFLQVHFHWINRGTTPAVNVRTWADHPAPDDPPDDEDEYFSVLGPGARFFSAPLIIDLAEAFKSKKTYTTYGTVIYRDIYNIATHRRTYCKMAVTYIGRADPNVIALDDIQKLISGIMFEIVEQTLT